MRIIIIGTAYPLRGGIAHYVSLLTQTLTQRGHDVHVLTFKRQYPKLLFPGKSQEEQGPPMQRAAAITSEAVIDSINPISWMKAGAIAANYKPDLLIFKFWLPFFAPAYGTIARVAKRLTRKRGHECKALFIADNVIPHEKRFGDLAFTKFAFRVVDYFVVQSDAVERDLKRVDPSATFVKLPHPIYELFGPRMDRVEARTNLRIPNDAPAILFFGYIRKYKGLDILLRAMPIILAKLPELRLIIAGEFYGDEAEYRSLITELDIPAKNLILATDYIPNEDVAKYFSAANVAVLPYRSATQSGIVQIAYNFDTPVIATDVGGLSEVVIDRLSGLTAHEATPEEVANNVIQFFEHNLEEKLTAGVIQEKRKYSWGAFAEGIEQLVHSA